MKKIVIILSTILSVISCKKETNCIDISFKIENATSDTLLITNEKQEIIKTFVAKEKGIFSDTLNVVTGMYYMEYNGEFARLFLKNGQNIKVKLNTKQFDETIKFSGEGEKENNFLAQNTLLEEKYDYEGLMKNDEKIFNEKVLKLKEDKIKSLKNAGLDDEFATIYNKNIENEFNEMSKYYKENMKMFEANGMMAYNFDYENYKGGTTKLSDLKGKFVYIDIWATWCGPCVQEIPFLQDIEKKYHGKNIEFVSISIDDVNQKLKWKEMIATKNMGGIQLLADKAWQSEICTSLNVTGIPRFVLIDQEGKIINANAPRPSNPELVTILNGLNL